MSGLSKGSEMLYILQNDIDFSTLSVVPEDKTTLNNIIIDGNGKSVLNQSTSLFKTLGPNVELRNLNIIVSKDLNGEAVIASSSMGGVFRSITIEFRSQNVHFSPAFGSIEMTAFGDFEADDVHLVGDGQPMIPTDDAYGAFFNILSGGAVRYTNCSVENYFFNGGYAAGVFGALISDASEVLFSNCTSRNVIVTTDSLAAGLVCAIEGPGDITISEFKIINSQVQSRDGSAAGMVILIENEGDITITDCENDWTVINSSNELSTGLVGIITSKGPSNILISACSNSGSVVNRGYAAIGILGGVGGPIGSTIASVIVQNCQNEGTIMGKEIAAGIFGEYYKTSDGTFRVFRCKNCGFITNGEFNEDETMLGHSAGIVLDYEVSPSVTTAQSMYEIEQCENKGQISGSFAAGIICECFAFSDFDTADFYGIIINDCTNEGKIIGTDRKDVGSGIAASTINGVKITECWNYGSVTDFDYSGGIVGTLFSNVRFPRVVTTIADCHDYAPLISARIFAGGIVASAQERIILPVINDDDYYGEVSNCTACGKIQAINDHCEAEEDCSSYAGGIVGGQELVFYIHDNEFLGRSVVSKSENPYVGRIISYYNMTSIDESPLENNEASPVTNLTGKDMNGVIYTNQVATDPDEANEHGSDIQKPADAPPDAVFLNCKGWARPKVANKSSTNQKGCKSDEGSA